MKILLTLILSSLSFFLLPFFVSDIQVETFGIALFLAILWGILALTVRPVILVLTLPINVLTLGLFTFVINALLLLFLGRVIEGFAVSGFGAAILGAIVLAVFHMLAGWLAEKLTKE
jgi:putative membrane protein